MGVQGVATCFQAVVEVVRGMQQARDWLDVNTCCGSNIRLKMLPDLTDDGENDQNVSQPRGANLVPKEVHAR